MKLTRVLPDKFFSYTVRFVSYRWLHFIPILAYFILIWAYFSPIWAYFTQQYARFIPANTRIARIEKTKGDKRYCPVSWRDRDDWSWYGTGANCTILYGPERSSNGPERGSNQVERGSNQVERGLCIPHLDSYRANWFELLWYQSKIKVDAHFRHLPK